MSKKEPCSSLPAPSLQQGMPGTPRGLIVILEHENYQRSPHLANTLPARCQSRCKKSSFLQDGETILAISPNKSIQIRMKIFSPLLPTFFQRPHGGLRKSSTMGALPRRRGFRRQAEKEHIMSLGELQEDVDAWVKTIGVRYFSELTNLGILMEEVGEVARIMTRRYGDQSFKENEKNDLGDELADVLFVLTCIANQTGVDLTEAMRRNLEKKTLRDKNRHRNNPKLYST
jgi:NTP pyrophosphatase (non-canonical NTP hydrolase)